MIGNRKFLGAAVAAVLVSSLGALAGCASDDKPEVALTGKQVQAASVTLTVHDVNGTQIGQGSGILIAPRLVMTSAHLVAGKARWSVTSADGTVKSNGIRGMTYDWMDYDNSQNAHPRKHDVAVIYLDKPINLDAYPKVSSEKLANNATGTRLRSNGSSVLQLPQTFNKIVGLPHSYLTDMPSQESVEPGNAVLNNDNEIVGIVTGRGLTTGQMYVARTNDLTDWIKPKAQCGGRQSASVRTYGTPTTPKPGCDTPGSSGNTSSGASGNTSSGASGNTSSGASGNTSSGASGNTSSGASGSSNGGTSGSSGQSSGSSGDQSSSGNSSSGGHDEPSCHDGGGHCHGDCHGVPNDGSSSGSSGTSGNTSSGSSGQTSSGASGNTSSGASGNTSSGASGSTSGTSGTSGNTSSGASGNTSSGASGNTSSGASGNTSSGASGSTSGTSGTSGQSSGSSGQTSSGASGNTSSGASGNTSSSGGAGSQNDSDEEVCEGSSDNTETCPAEADGCSGGGCGGAFAPDGLIDYGGCSSCSENGDDGPALVVR